MKPILALIFIGLRFFLSIQIYRIKRKESIIEMGKNLGEINLDKYIRNC